MRVLQLLYAIQVIDTRLAIATLQITPVSSTLETPHALEIPRWCVV